MFWIARQTGQNAYFVAMLRIGGELDGGFDLIIKRQIERRAMLKMAVGNFLCVRIRGIFSLERNLVGNWQSKAGKKAAGPRNQRADSMRPPVPV